MKNYLSDVGKRLSAYGRYEVIGHRICPYVQRVVIALEELGLDYAKMDISLENKPSWLSQCSPGGKVPVLMVDNNAIFDSEVICEYLYSIYKESPSISEKLNIARGLSWCRFSSEILDQFARLIYLSKNEESIEDQTKNIRYSIQKLTLLRFTAPYYSGDTFGVVDACYAPVFRYVYFFGSALDYDFIGPQSDLLAWSKNILERKSVMNCVPTTYANELAELIQPVNPFLYSKVQSSIA
ncbi:glutathione S-transferase family protein [Gilvimarinus sp. SDUM040013]|uniref:Glutathione S-transferase family protein n=1 Tax=Gilvimarinus gilvus TaxID=3058038 RepID=A0ABU4RVM2_9GAMM|nr:glutathione S-transferase family protein [Gilvimarinus sp. SDUM040013]MDO3387633.1 glutathione S-transferase family protein [Gilvimarinus sp. SDUM040013]MDX6848926.1 glutathione S-transferase family protein [Gilvimarinus sp. SDUM040013]